MRIDLLKIKGQLGRSVYVDYVEDLTSFDFKGEVFEIVDPLRVKGKITAQKEGLFAELDIKGSIRATCDRCLEEFVYPLDLKLREYVEEAVDEEVDDSFYENFDITTFVLHFVILSLPMKFLCKEDCKGLCPICGTNLNYGSCSCKREDIDPRLEVLSKLLQ
ncbi:YceD family protein [Caldanaerobacter sp.]|uniref:YceD family protein n=1 Tax=Caldanaerobacter sp. TaxID=2930036 RepID=UPI003C7445F8